MEIKQKIEKVLIESPYYGYKRVAAELKNQGEVFNHKRIYKIEYHYIEASALKLSIWLSKTMERQNIIIRTAESNTAAASTSIS